MSEWRDIPGFNGRYQIDCEGNVRSWYSYNRAERAKTPRLLKPYRRRNGYFVNLRYGDNKGKEYAVLRLLAITWLGGIPAGKAPYHRNGDTSDHCLGNIAFASPRELGKITGGKSYRRKPVVMYSHRGEPVEIYPSAAAAARANRISKDTVYRHCKNKVEDCFAYLGYSFCFEEDLRRVQRKLQQIIKQPEHSG